MMHGNSNIKNQTFKSMKWDFHLSVTSILLICQVPSMRQLVHQHSCFSFCRRLQYLLLGLARMGGICRSSGTAAAANYFVVVHRVSKRNTTFSHFPHDLVQCVHYVSMDFVKSVAVCTILLRTRAKRRKWVWVHPLVSQRLPKGQLHKLCEEDLCRPPLPPKKSFYILEWLAAVLTGFYPWLDPKLPTKILWWGHLCYQKKDWQ